MTRSWFFGFIASVVFSGAANADPYDDAMSRSAVLEQEDRHHDAALELEAVADQYPQDYALQLRLGWLHYQAGQYEEAGTSYQRALELSNSSDEATLGLAWSYHAQGRCDEANDQFELLIERDRYSDQALAGIGQCGSDIWLSPSISSTYHVYEGHPSKTEALGVTVGFPVLIDGHYLVGLDFRATDFRFQPAEDELSAFQQYEVYARTGYIDREWEAVFHYAWLLDGSELDSQVHVLGMSGRWSELTDLRAELSLSFYDDMEVFRVAPTYEIELFGWLRLTPGLAVQVAGDEALLNGFVTLSVVADWLTFFVGGKLGDEVRPAYLTQPSVYNIVSRIQYGLWIGASISFDELRFDVSYELNSLDYSGLEDSGSSADASLHLFTLRLAWTP